MIVPTMPSSFTYFFYFGCNNVTFSILVLNLLSFLLLFFWVFISFSLIAFILSLLNYLNIFDFKSWSEPSCT